LSFARRVCADRLIDACRWADSFGHYSYLAIDEILRKRLDKLQPDVETVRIPAHENIRGKTIAADAVLDHLSEYNFL